MRFIFTILFAFVTAFGLTTVTTTPAHAANISDGKWEISVPTKNPFRFLFSTQGGKVSGLPSKFGTSVPTYGSVTYSGDTAVIPVTNFNSKFCKTGSDGTMTADFVGGVPTQATWDYTCLGKDGKTYEGTVTSNRIKKK